MAKTATTERDLKRIYRELVKEVHPDSNPKESSEYFNRQFNELTNIYHQAVQEQAWLRTGGVKNADSFEEFFARMQAEHDIFRGSMKASDAAWRAKQEALWKEFDEKQKARQEEHEEWKRKNQADHEDWMKKSQEARAEQSKGHEEWKETMRRDHEEWMKKMSDISARVEQSRVKFNKWMMGILVTYVMLIATMIGVVVTIANNWEDSTTQYPQSVLEMDLE